MELADSEFSEPRNIDLLIGVELFFKCLNSEQIKFGRNAPILQSTKFGWVIAGPLDLHVNRDLKDINNHQCFLTVNENNSGKNSMRKFLEVKNIENRSNKFTNEELECELDFRKHVETDTTGRYVVKLPFKDNYYHLGDSYNIALKCLFSLENRLAKNAELRKQYISFLDEYEKLGHMTLVDSNLDGPKSDCV